MGLTLDQLLEQTGIKTMSGGQTKTASAAKTTPDFAKLAERCRQAVEEQPRRTNQELTEKVAQTLVCRKTLQELRAIENGEELSKVASSSEITPKEMLFIKTALQRGHAPRDIAEFLEKEAFLKRMGAWARQGIENIRHGRAVQQVGKATEKLKGSNRRWMGLLDEAAGQGEIAQIRALRKLQRSTDPATFKAIVEGANPNYKKLETYKNYAKLAPKRTAAGGAPASGFGFNIGSQQYDAGEMWKKHKKKIIPGAVGAGGVMALSNRKDDSGGGKGGPIIINR